MYKTIALLTNKKTIVFESRIKREKGDHVTGYVFDNPVQQWGGVIEEAVHHEICANQNRR